MKATWELVPIPYIPYSFWLNLNDLNAIAVILHLTPLIQWIGLRGKNNRKASYSMGKSMRQNQSIETKWRVTFILFILAGDCSHSDYTFTSNRCGYCQETMGSPIPSSAFSSFFSWKLCIPNFQTQPYIFFFFFFFFSFFFFFLLLLLHQIISPSIHPSIHNITLHNITLRYITLHTYIPFYPSISLLPPLNPHQLTVKAQ